MDHILKVKCDVLNAGRQKKFLIQERIRSRRVEAVKSAAQFGASVVVVVCNSGVTGMRNQGEWNA
jgi:hypothetical protein